MSIGMITCWRSTGMVAVDGASPTRMAAVHQLPGEAVLTGAFPARAQVAVGQVEKDRRDQAVVALAKALENPVLLGSAVDSLVRACVAEVNGNLHSELAQIRAIVHARPDETTYRAVMRLHSERDGAYAKYHDSRDRQKDVMDSLRTRIKLLERVLEQERAKR